MADGGIDTNRRRFLTATTSVVGAVGVGFAAVPFVTSMLPSARAKALGAPVEIDVDKLEPGQRIVVQWRGKPVWILRRTDDMLSELEALEPRLRDPDSSAEQQPPYARNPHRSVKRELLVVIGLCTHLGCSPLYVREDEAGAHGLGAEWRGGFFCPCHGSRFDLAGRVYQGVPAPLNLLVPPHRYSDSTVVIGEHPEGYA